MSGIEIVTSSGQMQEIADRLRREGKTISFVPTLGYLHEGHLSLMREARRHADILVVSIFLNPTQFGPEEDLEAYPKNLKRDIHLAEKEGVDVIFAPAESDMYPNGFQTYVTLENLPRHLCGRSRPIHFRGVATIVSKLFNIVKPHTAVFGRKDYQQLAVIRQMVRDLNFDIHIIGGPTVREVDGLAMSSRNTYLTANQRRDACRLYQALQKAQKTAAAGETDAVRIIDEAAELIGSLPDADIDYIKICDPETLEDVQIIKEPVLMALAVKIGQTRLIDNELLTP